MRTPEELLDHLKSDVVESARQLLGAVLVSDEMSAVIVEAEAYRAEDDLGSHAHRGMTPRNRSMFSSPGRAYVYFTYGMHWMLNVVAHPEGSAAAVLIRAAAPASGIELMRERRQKAKSDRDLLAGPAKITQAFQIDRSHDHLDLFDPSSPIRLLPGIGARRILTGVRVGMAPGKGDTTPWRFVDADQIAYSSPPKLRDTL